MSDTVKKDSKDKNESVEQTKKTKTIVQAKHIEYAKGPVIYDNIRKEINDCERNLERIWLKKYDHLSGENFRKVLANECAKAGIPVDTFERKLPVNPKDESPIPLKSSPMPMPKTSSAIVGWRSSRPEYNLEFVGPLYVSPKHTIEPPLIPGEFRVTKQKFIFLG